MHFINQLILIIMKKKSLALLGVFLGLGNLINAQHVCDFERQQEIFRKSHGITFSMESVVNKVKANAEYHNGTYVIPVVFHVFGEATNHESLKVTYDLIEDALRKTNEDFQGKTSDYNQSGPSSRFEKIKKPIDVSFRLAKIDPNGNATKGVVFYDEPLRGFGNGSGYDENIQMYAWDNDKYMNVYIMKDLYADGDLYNSGVSWLPDDYMTSNNLARVVYNGSYIGTNTDENFRRVLTHEFGHFLGLHHTFNGGCTYPNDGVEDTPPVESSHWNPDEVNCEGDYTDWENFMNYTDAYRHFTAGQVDLMEYYLNESNSRITLWQQDNLIATGVSEGYIQPASIAITKGKYIFETEKNIGEVYGSIELETIGGMTFAKTGKLKVGEDYTVENLPEGLNAELECINTTKSVVRISGSTTKHEAADSRDFLIKINSSVLKVEGGASIDDQKISAKVQFNDPYTSYCLFSPRFAPYAHILNVKFAQIDNTTQFDGEQFKDFRADHVAGVDKGKTYQLIVTAQNWRSGETDPYTVRVWFDWNGDFIFEPEEALEPQYIKEIGSPDKPHELTFNVTVPENIVEGRESGFRVMFHFTNGDDGEDPCGIIDSGDVEDYGFVLGEENAHVPDPGTVEPADEVCIPEFQYMSYAYISKVEFAGIVNETGLDGEDIIQYEDFRENELLHGKLEKGKEYIMKVTCRNLNSSKDDPYKVRAYIDWNHNNVLEQSESQKIFIPKIGEPNAPVTVEFKWTVPENVVLDEKLHTRVFFHYGKENSYDGENPCGTVESGQLEEYFVIVPSGSNIESSYIEEQSIYPNPTDGIINVIDIDVDSYMLYSIDGKFLEGGDIINTIIDISSYAPGTYILRLNGCGGPVYKTIMKK